MLLYSLHQIQIIEYLKILQVESSFIHIQCKNEQIKIKGIQLSLTLLNEDEMIIKGDFHEIQFI